MRPYECLIVLSLAVISGAAGATVASFRGPDVWFGALTCTDTPCAPTIEGSDSEFPVLLPGEHRVALGDGTPC